MQMTYGKRGSGTQVVGDPSWPTHTHPPWYSAKRPQVQPPGASRTEWAGWGLSSRPEALGQRQELDQELPGAASFPARSCWARRGVAGRGVPRA